MGRVRAGGEDGAKPGDAQDPRVRGAGPVGTLRGEAQELAPGTGRPRRQQESAPGETGAAS